MLTLNTKVEHATKIDGELHLPYDQREKSRLRASLTTGEEVAVFTVRGTVLRHGDLLQGDDGRIVKVTAAPEASYRVDCDDAHTLLRCAFHLGNRHTQAQIGHEDSKGFLRIRKDAVLKDMF
jgi:urease accessory protein